MVEVRDVETVYELPLVLEAEKLGDRVLKRLGMRAKEPDLAEWKGLVGRIKHPHKTVRIGVAGKYVEVRDSYKSIIEVLRARRRVPRRESGTALDRSRGF